MATRVLVIGAGITGVSIAEQLRRAGASVTLVDKVDPGDAQQASYGNAGMIARAAIVPVSTPGLLQKIPKMLLDSNSPLFLKWGYLPRLLPWLIPFLKAGSPNKLKNIICGLDSLTNDAVEQHLQLANGTKAKNFIKKGRFGILYTDQKSFSSDGLSRQFKEDYGYKYKKLDREDLLSLDPHISSRYNFGAVFNDHAWITDPGRYVNTLFEYFSSCGGKFLKSEVKEIDNKAIMLHNNEVLSADKVVIATGAWSNYLVDKLGVKSKIESERGYHIVFKGANRTPPFPFMIADGKFIATPMRGGMRCAGVVEFGGLKSPASEAPFSLIRRKIMEVYPDLQFEQEETWMGHRPSTPDSLPLIGPIDGFPDVICAFGSQHIGLTIGPKIGHLIADLILQNRTNFDLSPFKANRFN